MALGVKYSKQFQNIGENTTYRVDILLDTYAGDPIVPDRMSVGGVGVETLAGRKDEYPVVMGSEITFEFVLKKRANESAYDDLFTSEYGDYIVKFYNDDTSEVLWQGYMQPENMSKDIFESNLHISISATDALKDLSDYEFTDSGNIITGSQSALQIIKYCLAKLNDSTGAFEHNFVIKLGTQPTTWSDADDNILEHAMHDCRRFFTSEDGKTEIDTCLEVIEKVLEPYNCTLRQWGGKYRIQHRYEGDTNDYTYNWALTSSTKTTSDDGVDIDAYTFRRTGELSMLSPVKEMNLRLLNRNMGGQLVPDINDFSGTGPWDLSGVSSEDGDTVFHARITDGATTDMTLNNDFTLARVTDGDYIKLKFQIYSDVLAASPGNLPKFKITVTNVTAGTFKETWQTLIPNGWMVYESPNSETFKVTENADYNITITFIESDGASAPYTEDVYLKEFDLTKIVTVDDETFSDITFDKYYKATGTGKKTLDTKDMYFGDSAGTNDLAAIVYDGNTELWNREGEPTDEAGLLNLYALDFLTSRKEYTEYLILDILDREDNISPTSFIEYGGKIYTIASYSKNMRTGWLTAHLRERKTADITAMPWAEIPLTSVDGNSAVSNETIVVEAGTTPAHNSLSGLNVGDFRHLTAAELGNVQALDSMAYEATAAYYSAAELDGGQLDSLYYTETELDAGQLDNRYYTEAEVGIWRSGVTQTEMGYLHGVTSDIQTQLSGKVGYTGTPVDNQVAVWTAEGIIEGTNDLVFTATGLGIDNPAPNEKLDLNGNFRIDQGGGHYFTVENPDSTTLPAKMYVSGNDYMRGLQIGRDDGRHKIILLGDVGFGTDYPGYTADVNGTGRFVDNLYGDANVQHLDFASGWTGGGGDKWQITPDGYAEFDSMKIRGGLEVYELIINRLRYQAGGLIMGHGGGKIASVSGAAGSEVITVEDPEGNGFVPFSDADGGGSILLIQDVDIDSSTVVKQIVRQVSSIVGNDITLAATAGWTPGTANNDTGAIVVGDEIVAIGHTSTAALQNNMYMTVTDSDSPFIRIQTEVNSWADFGASARTKVLIGNLASLEEHGIVPLSPGYGLYSDNVYLTGKVFATSGEIGGFTIDETDGIYAGSGLSRIQMKPGTGFWVGADAIGDAPFWVGYQGAMHAYYGDIGGINLFDNCIYTSATPHATDGYAADGLTIVDDGSIHTPNFHVDADGKVGIRGDEIVYSYLSVSNDIIHTHSGGVETTSVSSYTLLKTMTLGSYIATDRTLNIYFELKSTNSAVDVYGKIYKNGVAVGTERNTISTSYVGWNNTIVDCNAGDDIELYAKTDGGAGNADVTNFQIRGTLAVAVNETAGVSDT